VPGRGEEPAQQNMWAYLSLITTKFEFIKLACSFLCADQMHTMGATLHRDRFAFSLTIESFGAQRHHAAHLLGRIGLNLARPSRPLGSRESTPRLRRCGAWGFFGICRARLAGSRRICVTASEAPASFGKPVCIGARRRGLARTRFVAWSPPQARGETTAAIAATMSAKYHVAAPSRSFDRVDPSECL
jgi:hypothetical protein